MAVLAPRLSSEQERQLREAAQKKLGETERRLLQIEARPLKPAERETLLLVQSLIDQAKKALTAEEYERASNLLAKAWTLTDPLTAPPK